MIQTPSQEQIDRLRAFRDVLYAEGFEPLLPVADGQRSAFGTPPAYHPAVLAFFRAAGEDAWCDYDFKPQEARAMLEDLEYVSRTDLAGIKTMLTFCVRGERFCDGHWAAMIEKGHIKRLLDRLAQLFDLSGN